MINVHQKNDNNQKVYPIPFLCGQNMKTSLEAFVVPYHQED